MATRFVERIVKFLFSFRTLINFRLHISLAVLQCFLITRIERGSSAVSSEYKYRTW